MTLLHTSNIFTFYLLLNQFPFDSHSSILRFFKFRLIHSDFRHHISWSTYTLRSYQYCLSGNYFRAVERIERKVEEGLIWEPFINWRVLFQRRIFLFKFSLKFGKCGNFIGLNGLLQLLSGILSFKTHIVVQVDRSRTRIHWILWERDWIL